MATRHYSLSIKPVRREFVIMIISVIVLVPIAHLLASLMPSFSPIAKEALLSASALILLLPFGYFLVALPVSNTISKGNQAKNALKNSEMHYRIVSELTTTFAFDLLVSQDGKISVEFISDNFYAFTGRNREEGVTLEYLLHYIHPERQQQSG